MARHPYYRSLIAIGVVAVVAAIWAVVLLWPGRAPLWLLVVLVLSVPAPVIAAVMTFDIARTSNPPRRLGSAIGVVNGGAFLGTLIAVMAIGLVLQVTTPSGSTRLHPRRVQVGLRNPIRAVGDRNRADAALPAADDPRPDRARPRRLRRAASRRPPVATDLRRAHDRPDRARTHRAGPYRRVVPPGRRGGRRGGPATHRTHRGGARGPAPGDVPPARAGRAAAVRRQLAARRPWQLLGADPRPGRRGRPALRRSAVLLGRAGLRARRPGRRAARPHPARGDRANGDTRRAGHDARRRADHALAAARA